MIYTVERTLPFSPFVVWSVLSDLTHFERNDTRRNDFELLGSQREGTGTKFRIKHTFWPIFPFRPNEVVCTVTEWKRESQLEVLEENRRAHRTHTQTFLVFKNEETLDTTIIQYEIRFPYPRSRFFFWDLLVMFMSTRRMNQKLLEIEKDCEKWLSEYTPHTEILHE